MGRVYYSTEPVIKHHTQTDRFRRELVTQEGAHVPISSIAIPLADLGIPIPYVAGRQRVVSPNIIWYGNLRPIIQETRSVETTTDTVTTESLAFVIDEVTTTEVVTVTRTVVGYNLSMQFGICLGPGVALRAIYVNDIKIWEGTVGPARTEFTITNTETFVSGDCIFTGGAFDQAKDPFLEDHIDPALLPGYIGQAYLIIKDVRADQIQGNLSFEVERFPDPLGLGAKNRIGDDINLASALADYLASSWGGAGAGEAAINDATFFAAGERLFDEENTCSIILQRETESSQVIDLLTRQADGMLFEDPATGTIKFELIRFDQLNPLTANVFDQRNVDRVVEWSRRSWVGTANKMRLSFTSRAKGYEEDSIVGYNFAAVNDKIKANRVLPASYPAAMNVDTAKALLARDLGISGQPIVYGKFQTNREVSGVLPGDTGRAFLPDKGLGPVLGVITKVQRFPLADNRTIVHMMQVPRQDTDIVFDPDTSLGDTFNVQTAAPTAVRIFTPPYWLARKRGITYVQTQQSDFIMAALLPTPANNVQATFGAYITNKPNAGGFVQVVDSGEYPCVAALDTAIGQFDEMDDGLITSVTISAVTNAGLLASEGVTGVRQGRLLMLINDEIFGFESATDNLDGTYTLGNVHRALIDTVPGAHTAGATVYIIGNIYTFLSQNVFNHPLGYTPGWRITSNTLTHKADPTVQFLASGTWSTTANRLQRPIRPHDTKIDGAARSASLTNELGGVGTIYFTGDNITVTWKTRHKGELLIPLQGDAAETGEVDRDGDYMVNRVMIRDAGDILRDCGATANDGTYNSLVATVNAATQYGLGYLFVRTESIYGNSLFEDRVPVTILPDTIYEPEDDSGDEFYVSEDDNFFYVGEGT